jgi:hypothetical protein
MRACRFTDGWRAVGGPRGTGRGSDGRACVTSKPRDSTSVEMRIFVVPSRNSLTTRSLADMSMSPWIDVTRWPSLSSCAHHAQALTHTMRVLRKQVQVTRRRHRRPAVGKANKAALRSLSDNLGVQPAKQAHSRWVGPPQNNHSLHNHRINCVAVLIRLTVAHSKGASPQEHVSQVSAAAAKGPSAKKLRRPGVSRRSPSILAAVLV